MPAGGPDQRAAKKGLKLSTKAVRRAIDTFRRIKRLKISKAKTQIRKESLRQTRQKAKREHEKALKRILRSKSGRVAFGKGAKGMKKLKSYIVRQARG